MENLFVECTEPELVAEGLHSYRRRMERASGWDFQPSYPTTLMVSPLRTTLDAGPDFHRHWTSTYSRGGECLQWNWIQVVCADDVVDLALARWLSETLHTYVIAVFSYDGADTYGSRSYRNGELRHDESQVMEERADYRTNRDLEILRIPFTIERYRDCRGPGWISVDLDPPLADCSS